MGTAALVVVTGTGVLSTLAKWMRENPTAWLDIEGVHKDLDKQGLRFFSSLDEARHDAPEAQNNAFRGSGDGDWSTLLAVVDRYIAHVADQWWRASLDTKALRAWASVHPDSAGLTALMVSANERMNLWTYVVLQRLASANGWELDSARLPELRRGLAAADSSTVVDSLRREVLGPVRAIQPPIIIAGGYKDLHRLLALLCRQLDLDLFSVADFNVDEPGLLRLVGTEESIEGRKFVRHLHDLRFEPAEYWTSRSRRGSQCSAAALEGMRERTRKWVTGNVWQGDRLTFMMRHDAEHGRKVDMLANSILRATRFLHDDTTDALVDTAHAALSAASWLHDVGQRGAVLNGRYVRDPEHIRLVHGALTNELLKDDPKDFGFQSEDPLRLLVGHLCRCHQRITTLDKEEPKPWACPLNDKSCDICERIRDSVTAPTLHDFAEANTHAMQPAVSPDVAVRLGAILRVADAADIGAHRVDGRWEAHTHGIEDAWRREWLSDYLNRQPEEKAKIVQPLVEPLFRRNWSEELPSVTQSLKRASVGAVADRLWALHKLLNDQVAHLEKHRPFSGSVVVALPESTAFTIQMKPSELWFELPADTQMKRFQQAAAYISTEYLQVERYFVNPKWGMAALNSIGGPGGLRAVPSEFRTQQIEESEAEAARSEPRQGTDS